MRDDELAALFEASQAERQHQKMKDPPTLSITDGVGLLTFKVLSLTNYEKGKGMPSRHRWEGRTLRFMATQAALTFIKQTFPGTLFPMEQAQPVVQPTIARNIDWAERKPSYKHQSEARSAAYRKKAFAYFMDMGTGKTKTFLDECAELVAIGELDRALVIAPNNVHRQWVDEQMAEHWPKEIPHEALAIIPGKKYATDWARRPFTPGTFTLVAVNIEAIKAFYRRHEQRYVGSELYHMLEQFLSGGRSSCAVDESHKIKNPQGVRTNAITALAEKAEWRRILTGTPMSKGPEDYYAQFRFLDAGILGVNSFAGFKNQFCVTGGFNGKEIIGYRNTERLHELIAPYSYRVEKSDVLDLPPKIFDRRYVELNAEQRRVYRELRIELMTMLTDGTIIETEQAVQRILRMQQVVQGFLPREDGTFEDFGSEERLAVLDDLIEGANGKVVIWCRFREDINRIIARYGPVAVRYDGEVGEQQRKENRHEFMDIESSVRLFVANAQAGGTGLNLAGTANTVVYYSNSFSSLDRWQSEDRTHRIGTRGAVTYYDLVARGTIDTSILANLRRKRDITDMSLTELKSLIEEVP
jgi:SNF2 family DNA or RNA helicase